jgi:hypothetical protein
VEKALIIISYTIFLVNKFAGDCEISEPTRVCGAEGPAVVTTV